MKAHLKNNKFFLGSAGALLLFFLALLIVPSIFSTSYSAEPSEIIGDVPAVSIVSKPTFVATHLPTPEPLKALYMTACVAEGSTWREKLKNLVNTSELNAIVIDVKDYSGIISIVDPSLQDATGGCKVKDMQAFVDELHKSGIYAIARLTVFQDPYYTKVHPELAVRSLKTGSTWYDNKGLAFIDVGAKPYWDYVIKLAEASYAVGFDEINFDYIRYPSDGNMQDANYTYTVGTSTRAEMLESFFSYLHSQLAGSGMKTSADLFGLTTLAKDDMGIGQVLERALPYFDYVAPMVYPSHFANGTDGFANPAEHPYEIISHAMSVARARELALDIKDGLATSTPSKLRPWLQDFDYRANYGVPEVRAEIKAVYDSGLTSWMVWDAGNEYTPDAYLPEKSS